MTPPAYRDFPDGISVIDTNYQRPRMTAVHLMVEGDRAALIDTGTCHSVPNVLAVLNHKGIAPEQVDYVIPTHVHLDHAGGAGEMIRRFPNARLVIHPRGARHVIDPSKLIAGVMEVYGPEETARNFGAIVPVPAERVIEAPDMFTLDLNGRELLFLDTPGHARHHFCVVDPHSRSIFTGDTFGVSYREFDTENGEFVFPTTTPVQFDPAALHASIDRLLSYRPQQMLVTHFGRVGNADRLAEDMHALVDAFVQTALAVRDAGPGRHALLIEGQRELLRSRLRAHGCRLDEKEIERLLASDYELNAQGLEVWLDREQRH